GAPSGGLVFVKENKSPEPQQEANQTVRLEIDATGGPSSIRIGFTDQRLSAHGGVGVGSHCLRRKHFRKELEQRLPHRPCSPNAYQPSDIALGFVGGVLAGADK